MLILDLLRTKESLEGQGCKEGTHTDRETVQIKIWIRNESGLFLESQNFHPFCSNFDSYPFSLWIATVWFGFEVTKTVFYSFLRGDPVTYNRWRHTREFSGKRKLAEEEPHWSSRSDVTRTHPGQLCHYGGGGCHCGQLGDSLEDTGRQAKLPLDIFAHFGGGIDSERAGARPGDVLQQQQKCPECVSRAVVSCC